ncbi:uncharacterized protein MONOS_11864 [Monocercomonoides exilis]|uniref:uncharacterized protein n=1 Tax=Monocercomonoides exilis TaxID=2049356 RepID=UPI0035597A3F|nr:hypothetical protein MONOS_11864 [Monocercomonoides exilis]|eukprot:MONOS_11864.1-p1 / transcript=MONOS_11864.1 / gene=MONOS_11864 / organism=Monocercomonoides_exilis_PA203 / gene_product=unspecified product / transcript_product=unspecified product / location=Mono_scaffold00620:72-1314(-) / protein_length=296 / sequence_SO=supercontig / SO=protein_coding / is_pseudo=false
MKCARSEFWSNIRCGSTKSANGGSATLCAGEANEVKVKGYNFDGCFCSATDGLGISLFLPHLVRTQKSGEMISLSFHQIWKKLLNQKTSQVRGYDNGNNSVAIPLCIYLLPTPEEIHVSNTEASDHSHCGIVQFPCLTLKHSLTRLTGTKKVVVNGMISMGDELAFSDQKHEIRGNDDQSGWTVSDSSSTSISAMITAGTETELSKLIFSLSSSLPLHSIFNVSSSSSLLPPHPTTLFFYSKHKNMHIDLIAKLQYTCIPFTIVISCISTTAPSHIQPTVSKPQVQIHFSPLTTI